MGKITLSGALPTDAENGLATDAVVKRFIERPKEAVLVVALVSNFKTMTNHDKGTTYPVLRVRHWEAVPDDMKGEAADILAKALESRTGAMVLPFEPGEEVIIQQAGDDEDDEDAG